MTCGNKKSSPFWISVVLPSSQEEGTVSTYGMSEAMIHRHTDFFSWASEDQESGLHHTGVLINDIFFSAGLVPTLAPSVSMTP